MKKSELNGPPIRRLYYSSRELSRLTGRDSQELRDWEARFPALRPSKSKTGRRLYRPSDMELVCTINKFMNQGLGDDDINQVLKNPDVHTQPEKKKSDTTEWHDAIKSLQQDLKDLLQIIDEDIPRERDFQSSDQERENRIS